MIILSKDELIFVFKKIACINITGGKERSSCRKNTLIREQAHELNLDVWILFLLSYG